MIIFPSLPSGHSIFCDDIRHEVGGKISLVGVYSKDLLVQEFPVTLPKLCIQITINEKVDSGGSRKIKLILSPENQDTPDEDELTLLDFDYNIPDEAIQPDKDEFVMRTNKLELIASPFKVESAGRLKVRMYHGDDELRLGTILIRLDDHSKAQD